MKYLYISPLIFLIIACKSPSKLLEEGNFKSAFKKAVSEVKKGKNIEENIKVIERSAHLKVNEAISYSSIMTKTEKVSDWINTQNKVYVLLEDLGKANKILKGKITKTYDVLCNEKKEIDYQIVDYFYEEGHDHLDRFYNEGNKVDARHAYNSFKKCEKYEGQNFFQRLNENIEDAYQNGIMYYVSNYGQIGNRLFLKPLPSNAEFKPDCDISIWHGMVSYSSSESSSNETQTKEIEIGKEEIKDTSGHITYKPIYKTIEATITKKEISVSASMTTHQSINNITGQCALQSKTYHTQASDSYEEVTVSGDVSALRHHVNTTSGEPAFMRSNLKQELINQANRKIGF